MIVSKRLLAGVMTAMMITGMCAVDVSAAEKKTVTDYQAYAANLDKSAYSGNDLGAYSKRQLPSRYGRLMRRLFV